MSTPDPVSNSTDTTSDTGNTSSVSEASVLCPLKPPSEAANATKTPPSNAAEDNSSVKKHITPVKTTSAALANVPPPSKLPTSYSTQVSVSASDGYRVLLNRLTMGLVDWLKFHPNVTSLKVSDYKKAERSDFSNWEQKHMCILPDDLKAFYSTLNGLNMSWSISMNSVAPGGLNFNQTDSGSDGVQEKDAIQVGLINVNSLNKLARIAGHYEEGDYGISLADIESDDEYCFTDPQLSSSLLSPPNKPRKPRFNEKSRIFELDYVEKLRGRVCLVYNHTRNEMPAGPNPEIWFLDRSLSWHFMAPDFTTYFRLMILHLGLPEWHFLFTNMAISHKARQWFNFFAPTRLLLSDKSRQGSDNPDSPFETPMFHAKFDTVKVFKAKSVRVAGKPGATSTGSGANVQKKKPDSKVTSQSTTPASGTGSTGSASKSPVAGSQRTASAGLSRRS